MATRKRNWVDPKTREKIKVTQLINRLQGFALGKSDPTSKKPIVMTAAQVKAAQVCINKVMPDLSSSEIIQYDDASPADIYEKLKSLVGEDIAAKLVGQDVVEKINALH